MNSLGRLLIRLGADPAPDDDFWYRSSPMSANSSYIGPDTSLRLGAYSACVRVISETLASLDLTVYKRNGNSREADRGHALAYVLGVSPNEYMTAFELWELAGKHLCTWGNFYARIETDTRDNVRALYPIPPNRVNVRRDQNTGLIVYTYSDESGESKALLSDEMFHVPGMGYDGVDQLVGLSPVDLHRQSIGLSADAESYGARYFRNNATPPAYISSPGVIKDDTKTAILNYFARQFGGVRNAGKLGFLDNGAELKTVPVNHRDMQFLELRKYQVEEIARIHRVPLHMIQSLDHATNNNIEFQGIGFGQYTMAPWCERIEKRINMQLLGPREGASTFVKFELDSIMRGDAISRAEYYSKRITSGNMTPNEARIRENDNPLPGGDKLYIQGAMVPLEMAGQQAPKEVIQ